MFRRALSASALAALVLGVGGGLSSASAKTKTKPPFQIAMVADLTGAGSTNGLGGVAGAQAAVAYINSTGGISSHKLKLTLIDDQSSTTDAPAAGQQAVSLHPSGILDSSTSTYFTLRQPVYASAAIPVVTNTSSNVYYPWMYTVNPTAYQEGLTFTSGIEAELNVKSLSGKTIAYVGADTTGDHAQLPSIVAGIQAAGGSVVDTEFNPFGAATFNGAPNIVAKNPSIVAVADSGPDGIIEVNALRNDGYKGPIYSNYGASATTVFTTLNSPLYGAQWLAPETLPKTSIAWKWAVKTNQTGEVSNYLFSDFWSSTLLYADALAKCGYPCPSAKMEKNLAKIGRITPPGDTAYGLFGVKGTDHVLMTGWEVATLKNGKFTNSKVISLGPPNYTPAT